MRAKLGVLIAATLLVAAVPILAHHSIAAEFDSTKTVTVTGTVTKLDWMNPHIWVYLDAKDASGKITKWQFEGGPPNSLRRNGWTKDALKEGDMVTVEAIRAKDPVNAQGVYIGNARNVTLPGGKKVFSGSAEDGGKQQ
ncbi:MAG: hypothetical protein JWO19_2624 [Bryobacterales bacterium]|nr:hypothetical protein [Bryobacterales bacterium]